MRVVMIITEFYPHIGGAQRQLALLGRELQAIGVGAQVLTAHFPGFARRETVDGLPVVRLTSPGRGGRWSKWGNLVFLARLAIWLVKHHSEYDIVHAHIASVAACVAVGIGRVLGKGTVVKVANSGPYSDFRRSLGRHGFLGRLFLGVLRRADAIVSIAKRSTGSTEDEHFNKLLTDITTRFHAFTLTRHHESGINVEALYELWRFTINEYCHYRVYGIQYNAKSNQ